MRGPSAEPGANDPILRYSDPLGTLDGECRSDEQAAFASALPDVWHPSVHHYGRGDRGTVRRLWHL